MAYGSIAAPGTEVGPCEEPCQHTDCAASRRQAAEPCEWCGEPIGFDRLFGYWGDEGRPYHSGCLEKALGLE